MTTKFDIGQEVYFTNDTGISKGYVSEIRITGISDHERGFDIYLLNSDTLKRFECAIAATKEELIAKL